MTLTAKSREIDDVLRLRSVVEGRLLVGPETLQINLRNACNLNCDFCWNHSPLTKNPPQSWYRERLSNEHLDAIIDALPQLRPARVLLSGRGEPLLHTGVERLLAALQDNGIPVTVQTNGVAGLSPRRLVDLGVSQLLVNVSAGTREGYESIHPGRGRHFFDVVSRLSQIAELRHGSTPRVTLLGVMHRGNCGEAVALVELAARVGASSVQLKGMEIRDDSLAELGSLMLTPEATSSLTVALVDARQRAQELGVHLDDDHLRQVVEHRKARGSFTDELASNPCYMGWYYLRVTCDGRVMFCCKDKLVDHLDRRPLYRIWRGAGYQMLRVAGRDSDTSVALLDDKCRSCSNFVRNRQVGRTLLDA